MVVVVGGVGDGGGCEVWGSGGISDSLSTRFRLSTSSQNSRRVASMTFQSSFFYMKNFSKHSTQWWSGSADGSNEISITSGSSSSSSGISSTSSIYFPAFNWCKIKPSYSLSSKIKRIFSPVQF